MECELCGKDCQNLKKVEIEGTIVEVCDSCARFGIKSFEIGKPSEKQKGMYKPIKREIDFSSLESRAELIEGYGAYVKKARLAKGLNIEQLAKRLNEKASVLRRIEHEQMRPDEKLVKKIERFLGIELEKYED